MSVTVKWACLVSLTTSLVKVSVFKCQVVYRIYIYVENLVLFNKIDGAAFLSSS